MSPPKGPMAESTLDIPTHPSLSHQETLLITQITEFTHTYFQNPKFDASHDFKHVMRVVRNTLVILESETKLQRQSHQRNSDCTQILNAFTVIAGALLHDVDDKKYIDPSYGNAVPLAKQELLRLGISEDDAETMQRLVEGVSYSSEVKDVQKVQHLIHDIPELAVVQDADRLDAFGAIGIARCFTFGAVKKTRTLELSLEHFHDKLLKLEGMMKTETGKKMASQRTRRLREYLAWWSEEASGLA